MIVMSAEDSTTVMSAESRKLAIEETKLVLDQQRLELERQRDSRERKFMHRHAATLIAAAVSLTAVINAYLIARVQRSIDAKRMEFEMGKAHTDDDRRKREDDEKRIAYGENMRREMMQFVERNYAVLTGTASSQRNTLLKLLTDNFRNAAGYDDLLSVLVSCH